MNIPLEFREDYQKIQRYCACQEHCEFDVSRKLRQNKIPEEVIELFISLLKKENFINDERYCYAFTNDHFSIKRWGKLKIQAALKSKFLPDREIQKAIHDIPIGRYLENLEYLILKKENELLNEKDLIKKKAKIIRYLASNGYEMNLIYESFN